jgi:hypothetical protein
MAEVVSEPPVADRQCLGPLSRRLRMKYTPWLDIDLAGGEQSANHRDMDTLREICGVSILLQPQSLGVILHG